MFQIWYDYINNFKQSIKSLEDSGLSIKGEPKEQRGRFLSMLIGTSGASLLGNLLSSKEVT